MEEEIAREAAKGEPVKMRVLLKHDGPSRRPSEIIVSYSVRGKAKVHRFRNERETKSMEEMDVKRLLSGIAESCGDLIGEEGDFVLYVQGDGNFVATSIYHDRGTDIAYVRPDDELIELIDEFRNMLPDDQRWSLMNLVVHGVKVDAVFEYDDRAIDVGTSLDDDPRHLAAWAALGKKQIEYPLSDEGDADQDPPS